MRILTNRLELRDVVDDDWGHIWRYSNTDEFRRQLLPGMATESGVRRQVEMARAEQNRTKRRFYYLAVIRLEDGEFIGTVGLTLGLGKQAIIGWDCDLRFRNNGYATEAARALLRHSFQELGLREIRAACFVENAASIRVMEKLGMTRLQRNLIQRWCDHLSYTSLRPKAIYRILCTEAMNRI